MSDDDDEFSVAVFNADGKYAYAARWLSMENAVKVAKLLTDHVGMFPALSRVIITDGGDSTVFEWKRGVGITWPTNSSPSST